MWGNSMSAVERRVLEFFEKNIIWFLYGFISIAALAIRWQFIEWESPDYISYLGPWFEELKEAGGIRGLGQSIGNYNVLYLFLMALLTYIPLEPITLIKSLSFLFEFFGAFLAVLLCTEDKMGLANITSVMIYSVLRALPNVFINSAVWAQCDFSYTAFVLLSVCFLLKEKFFLAMIAFGIAFCFKLQAIFFLPVLLVCYVVKKKFSIINFLWWPGMWLLTSIPALLMGRSFDSILRIYKDQVTLYNWLTLSYPNVYYFFQKTGSEPEAYANFSKMAIILTMLILAVGCTYAVKKRFVDKQKDLLLFSTWCLFTCVMFLPAMHERYGFAAEIFVVCYAFSDKRMGSFAAAVLMNGVTIINYIGMMFWTIQVPYYILTVCNLAAYVLLTYLLLKQGIQRSNILTETVPNELNGVPT